MRWLAASAKTLLVLIVSGVLVFSSARAADTIISVIVCSASEESSLLLYEPLTDSVVNQPNVVVFGLAKVAGTVKISVDDAAYSTLQIESADSTFYKAVTVGTGTHEITVALDNTCGALVGSVSAVITYNPTAQPTQGTPEAPAQSTASGPEGGGGGSVAGSVYSHGIQSVLQVDAGGSARERLAQVVIDESQPFRPVDNASLWLAVLPFVVGFGAFGWVHFRRSRRPAVRCHPIV